MVIMTGDAWGVLFVDVRRDANRAARVSAVSGEELGTEDRFE